MKKLRASVYLDSDLIDIIEETRREQGLKSTNEALTFLLRSHPMVTGGFTQKDMQLLTGLRKLHII